MSKILISINPEHIKNIISGIKKFEYRTRVAKRDISSIIVYSTYPDMHVVAEVEIVDILSGSPDELWKKTKEYSGITKEFFDKYFLNRSTAYAYRLGKVKVFDTPKELVEFGVNFPPQSYVYIKS